MKRIAQLGIRHKPSKRPCPSPCGRALAPIQEELGEGHPGQLDSAHSSGSKARVFHRATLSSIRTTTAGCRENTGLIRRDRQTSAKESNCSSHQGRDRVCQPNLYSTQRRRKVVAGVKSQSIKPLCHRPTLQDGVDQVNKRSHSGGGLAGEARLKGCLPDSSSASLPPEVPQVLLAGSAVAIHRPPIWTEQCTLHLYQTNETSGSDFEEVRDPSCSVPRRYAPDGRLSRQGQGPFPTGSISLNCLGVCAEYRQVCVIAQATDRILRIQAGFHHNDDFITTPEDVLIAEISEAACTEITGSYLRC